MLSDVLLFGRFYADIHIKLKFIGSISNIIERCDILAKYIYIYMLKLNEKRRICMFVQNNLLSKIKYY